MNSIIFSAPMIRALKSGAKTQTRRVMPPLKHPTWTGYMAVDGGAIECGPDYPDDKSDFVRCRYGKPGDQLWVRETWAYNQDPKLWDTIRYAADGEVRKPKITQDLCGDQHYEDVGGRFASMCDDPDACKRLRPSIHMPRWASRFTIELTAVRVQRVQDISEEDVIAEGLERTGGGRYWLGYALHEIKGTRKVYGTAVQAYQSLWDSINASSPKRNHPWSSNPWIWVLEFKLLPPAEATTEFVNEQLRPACAGPENTTNAEAGGNSNPKE